LTVTGLTTPAPGALERVRAFVNTLDVDTGTDDIDSPSALGAWLVGTGLVERPPRASATDVARAKRLREALRDALAANHGGSALPAGAAAVLDEAARRARLRLRFDADAGWSPIPEAAGVDRALGLLLGVVATAMTEGTWSRLKVCENDVCRWAFYDTSRSRSGRWCSMRLCGNRAKQQAWRARHETPGPHPR